MATILKIVGFTLIIFGIIFMTVGNRFQDGRYWFGPYDEVSEAEDRRENRYMIVGVVLLAAGFILLKYGIPID